MLIQRQATPNDRKSERPLPWEHAVRAAALWKFLGPPSQIACRVPPFKTSLQHGRDMAESKLLLPFAFHVIQTSIRGAQQLFDAGSVGRKYRQTHADTDRWLLAVVLQFLPNAGCYLASFLRSRFRQDQGELVASKSRGCVNRAAAVA